MQTSFNIRKKLAILSLKGIKQLINFYYKQSKDNHKLKAKRNLDSSILLALNEITILNVKKVILPISTKIKKR